MSSCNLPNVPSFRKQQLFLEFASLKYAAPPGVYMNLGPGDPTLWTGVIFVRSDTPRGRSTVLSDERAGTVPNDNQNASGSTTESSSTTQPPRDDATETDKEASLVPGHPISTVPVVALLDYIRSTFDDATVLDSVPLAAAGNPSAWHAWKAHRRGSSSTFGRNSRRGSPQTRLPGDWHWDGIWAKRAKDEIEASHSEATLFGSSSRTAGDEMIRFSRLDDAAVETVKEMVVQYMEDVRW
ncbi:hypothetical protein MPDQ_004137 [Monascus purpureus]|uniref:UBC core domain-containing protein n=1 Tax=Monascus purpureus TaxID=5098 RepID=A0A507QHU0_MONPU|nr:hypothetical protein MPDQ_004137 [Monascus purpureus]